MKGLKGYEGFLKITLQPKKDDYRRFSADDEGLKGFFEKINDRGRGGLCTFAK